MTQDDLLDFLKSNADKKYRSDQLSKLFGVTTSTMTMTLTALGSEIENETNGHKRMWWYMSDESRKEKQDRAAALEAKKSRMVGVYQMPQALRDQMARCRADRGSEFHPVSMSSHSQFNVLN